MRSTGSKEVPLTNQVIDYDLHGIVGVRLVNPSESDAMAVANQLGPLLGSLQRNPDIIIRFERELPIGSMIYLGLDSAGFTKDGFYVLRSSKAPAKARIPFEKIGNACEIVCESGLRSVPLLLAIINFTFLKKDFVPLHASGFVFNGIGGLVTGWAKGGKTEALLAFANHGAQYVGDEWLILSRDGEQMYGIPEPIRLWDWQLKYIPRLRTKIPTKKKVLFRSIRFLDEIHEGLAKRGSLPFPFLNLAAEALPALKRQLNVRIPPREIFNGHSVISARPDKVFFLLSHEHSSIEIEPCDPEDIARRMANCNYFEQAPFFEHYQAFRFAFPRYHNEFLENALKVQESLLRDGMKGKESFVVFHPYPVPLERLYEQMVPYFCEG